MERKAARQKLITRRRVKSVSGEEQHAEVLRDIGCTYIRIASIAVDMAQWVIVTNDRIGGREAAISPRYFGLIE